MGVSVRKRLRHSLQRDPEALSAVLHMLLPVIDAWLHERARRAGRLGAVSDCVPLVWSRPALEFARNETSSMSRRARGEQES
jgi:hypothetical protein